ncbi:hypothetical protein N8787_02710 [Opitutaceae bacterium]|nr:hypothetical protein [Opitutaceae bacterium]
MKISNLVYFAAFSVLLASVVPNTANCIPLSTGDILWMDRGNPEVSLNSRIVRIDPGTGTQSIYAEGGLLGEGYSTDMAFASNGDILVA